MLEQLNYTERGATGGKEIEKYKVPKDLLQVMNANGRVTVFVVC